jgi:hypothetical protein
MGKAGWRWYGGRQGWGTVGLFGWSWKSNRSVGVVCGEPAGRKWGEVIKVGDMIKRFMSYPKCRSVKIINNPARPGSNHREVNYIKLQIINEKELKRTFKKY